MLKKNFRKVDRLYRDGVLSRGERGVFMFLALCFLVGSIIGSFVGSVSLSDDIFLRIEGIIASSHDSPGYISSLWNCSWYHLVLILLASSVLGVAAVPVFTAMRGYILSCTAASIISSYPPGGWLIAAVVLGIPALITLPCFMVLASDSLVISGRLLSVASGNTRTGARIHLLKHCVVCFLFLVVTAFIETLLVPELVAMIL